jgi:hypothetical protein
LTIAALVATLASVGGALVVHAGGDVGDASWTASFSLFFTALFAARVVGQLGVLVRQPRWLPPLEQWNLLPYPILLPIQLVLLGVMAAVTTDLGRGAETLPAAGPAVGYALAGGACLYWAAMAVRYAVRMRRRRDQRWFGGAIPIVFHCVLAAWLFVLGLFHAGG